MIIYYSYLRIKPFLRITPNGRPFLRYGRYLFEIYERHPFNDIFTLFAIYTIADRNYHIQIEKLHRPVRTCNVKKLTLLSSLFLLHENKRRQ